MFKSSNPYKRYLLGLLMVLLAFNFADRQALGLVLENVKTDLQLNDTQLGFLSGFAFALFYSVMGIPIARWADRGNRAAIISLSVALWSVTVSLCGVAGSFVQLLLIRVGVAVGEAGGFVPAFSLLADYFTRAERPRAVAIYTLGAPLSGLIGYWAAGWLNQLYGWRIMFALLGMPGLALAALSHITLREPRRDKSATNADVPVQSCMEHRAQPGIKDVFVALWASMTFRHLMVCESVMFFFLYGISQWQPTFFLRSYGLTSAEMGTWFAAIFVSGGVLGTYLGGIWAARYASHNERLQLKAVATAMAFSSVLLVVVYLSPTVYLALAVMGGVAIVQAAVNGPLYSTIQTLVPENMRAMAIALMLMCANLIGMGFGPLATGALSDLLQPLVGKESVRFALLMLAPGYFWAAWHAWCASKTVALDIASVLEKVGGSAVGNVTARNSVLISSLEEVAHDHL